jgi:hypothetical protein
MHKKNLIPQTTQPLNRITLQDLPTPFVELSDKDLQQIFGGRHPYGGGGQLVGGNKKLD